MIERSVRYVGCLDLGIKSGLGFFEKSSFSGTCLTGKENESLTRLDSVTKSSPGFLINCIRIIELRVGRHPERRFTKSEMGVVHKMLSHRIVHWSMRFPAIALFCQISPIRNKRCQFTKQ